MAYKITHGTDTGVLEQRRETATATLELVKKLQAENKPKIKISDRNETALTVSDLKRFSDKENI